MSRQDLVELWRRGHRNNQRFQDVKRALEPLGFTFEERGKHVFKVRHAALVGCPDFPFGYIGIRAHDGEKGEVDPGVIKDIVRALKWIQEQ